MRLNKTFAIIAICMGIGNMGLCFSVLNTTLAVIQKDLHASTLELQWILNMYGIFIAPFLVIMGRLGDKFGYKKIFCLGLVSLAISTTGTAFSPTAHWIIFFQIFFGLAGAILLPLSQVLLLRLYGKSNENKAMTIWVSFAGLSLGFGPIVAGLLVEYFSWRAPFGLMAIFAVLSLILTLVYVEDPKRNNPPTLDIGGTLLLMATIACFVLAVMQTGTWYTPIVVGLYMLSIILLIILLVIEKHVKNPIIQEHLFKNRTFLCTSITNALIIFFAWAYLFLIPLYMQNILHHSILYTGIFMLFMTIPLAIISRCIGKAYQKFGAKKIVIVGYICFLVTTSCGIAFATNTPLWFIALANFFAGTCWALIMVPSASAAMECLDHDNAGAGAGTFNTLQEIGGVVGLTIVVTVVRLHHNFMGGLDDGFWTLTIFGLIGLVFAFLIRNPKRHTGTTQS